MPQILGYPKAAQLIIFSDKMSAEEAYIGGLVSSIYKDNEFMKKCTERIKRYEKTLCMDSMITSKNMMRGKTIRDKLMAINKYEKEILNKQMEKEECQVFLMEKFMKSKL